jgi:hypothetical protein
VGEVAADEFDLAEAHKICRGRLQKEALAELLSPQGTLFFDDPRIIHRLTCAGYVMDIRTPLESGYLLWSRTMNQRIIFRIARYSVAHGRLYAAVLANSHDSVYEEWQHKIYRAQLDTAGLATHLPSEEHLEAAASLVAEGLKGQDVLDAVRFNLG